MSSHRPALPRFHAALLAGLCCVLLSCSVFDLTVDSIVVPSSVAPGDTLPVTTRVCNHSDEPTEAADLELALRPLLSDGSAAGPEVPIGLRGIPPLEARQCHTELSQLVAPTGLPDGPHQVIAAISPLGHRRASATFGIGWGPDLIIEAIDRPLNAAPWSSSELTGRVCNRGTDWAPPSQVHLYLSVNDQLVGGTPQSGPADRPAGSFPVPDLAPGACATVPGTLETSDPDQGLFALGAIVDEYDSIPELLEKNNGKFFGLLGVGWLPDLIVDSIVAPTAAESGAPFEVRAVVCNAGTMSSVPTEVSIYLSEDRVIRPIPAPHPGANPALADHFVGTLPVPQLEPDTCHSSSGMVNASPSLEGAWTVGAVVDEPNFALELMEFNNRFAGPQMGIGYGPDLVVKSIHAPHSAEHDQSVDIDIELCNQGTANASSTHGVGFSVRVFLSQDTTLESMLPGVDLEIGMAPAPDLPEGACSTLTVPTWIGATLTGPVHVFAQVDAFDEVEELIETNNEAMGDLIGIGSLPDLVMIGIEAPPSVENGASFEIVVDVCNHGTVPSMPTSVSLYHSKDEIVHHYPPTPYDHWLGEIQVDGTLLPGTCQSLTGNVTADSIATGAWHIGGVIDEQDYVIELIETNNEFTGPIMGLGQGPDLIVTRLEAPASALPGSSFSLDFEICNQGTSMSGSSEVSFWLSVDTVLEGGPPVGMNSDQPIGNEFVPMLEPGRCHVGSGLAWLPSEISGALHLGALADEPESIVELVESNNAYVGSQIGVGHGPDLILTRIDGPPTALASGSVPIDLQVCNQGTMGSPASQVWLYVSRDEHIEGGYLTMSSDVWIAAQPLPPMPPGACHDEIIDASLLVPEYGEWYLGGIVDEDMQVSELIESNNVRLGQLIGIGNGPDLVVASIDVPSSAENGLSFPVAAEICNQGTMTSSHATVTLYHSEDDEISGYGAGPMPMPDFQFSNLPVDPLSPGECREFAGSGSTWVTSDGPWFAGAIVDEDQLVAELIESNNIFVGPLMGVGLGPDLAVTQLSAPASIEENMPFDVDIEICNGGTMWSSMTTASFYHSEDGIIDGVSGPLPPFDQYLGDLSIPDLPPSGCMATTVQLFSGTPAAGYLAVVVDEPNLISELIESNNPHLGPPLEVTSDP